MLKAMAKNEMRKSTKNFFGELANEKQIIEAMEITMDTVTFLTQKETRKKWIWDETSTRKSKKE